MALRADQSQRLGALCLLGCLLLSYPLLALFNRPLLLWGVPLIYAYLLGAWALLIALMAWATRRGARDATDTGGR
jgi:CHASE2 domain-containing sensor protein